MHFSIYINCSNSSTFAIFYHLIGYACCNLFSCAILSVVIHKASTGVDQVHYDGVVHLEGAWEETVS